CSRRAGERRAARARGRIAQRGGGGAVGAPIEAPRAAADGGTRLGGAESKRRRRSRLPAPPSRVTLLAALRRPGPRDPEPPHQRLQRRAFHSEPGCGAPRATEHPVRLPEDAPDVRPLHILEGRGSVLVINPRPTPLELG